MSPVPESTPAHGSLQRWSIAIKIIPVLAVLVAARAVVEVTDSSFIDLTTLFGSMVAANVFVLGFLLAGTLADYKESERLPSELAASIETIVDECLITWRHKRPAEAADALRYMSDFAAAVVEWFYKRERTNDLLGRISGMNGFFLQFESLTQPNFIVRMKQEQNNIRRMVLRIDAIRDTSFLSVGYTLSYIATGALIAGLLFANIEPYYEAMFYLAGIGFMMVYLTLMIRDVDNPFDHYSEGAESVRVSLKPVIDVEQRIRGHVDRELTGSAQIVLTSAPEFGLLPAGRTTEVDVLGGHH
jgi:uncharacterized Tic20 family protein